MNAEISVFIICVAAVMYLLLYNLHDCTFNSASKLLLNCTQTIHSFPICVITDLAYLFFTDKPTHSSSSSSFVPNKLVALLVK